jgi:hypothetical protein
VTVVGYTLMCEQAGPKELVRDVQMAEAAGFERFTLGLGAGENLNEHVATSANGGRRSWDQLCRLRQRLCK